MEERKRWLGLTVEAGIAIIVMGATGIAGIVTVNNSINLAVSEIRMKNESQDLRIKNLEDSNLRALDEEAKFRDQMRLVLQDQTKDISTALRNIAIIEERTRPKHP